MSKRRDQALEIKIPREDLKPTTPLEKLNPLGAHLLHDYYSEGVQYGLDGRRRKKIEKNLYTLNSPKDIPIIMSCESPEHTYGMIVVVSDKHRTPVIVRGNEVIILESLGSGTRIGANSIAQIGLAIKKIPRKTYNIFAPEQPRQTDSVSCGTDAFLALKEAFRLEESLFDYIKGANQKPTPIIFSNANLMNEQDLRDPFFYDEVASVTRFRSLPPEILKYTQSVSKIKGLPSSTRNASIKMNSPVKRSSSTDTETVIGYLNRNIEKREIPVKSSREAALTPPSSLSDSRRTFSPLISPLTKPLLATHLDARSAIDRDFSDSSELSIKPSMVKSSSVSTLRARSTTDGESPDSSLSSRSFLTSEETDSRGLDSSRNPSLESIVSIDSLMSSLLDSPSAKVEIKDVNAAVEKRRKKHVRVTEEKVSSISSEDLDKIILQSSGINLIMNNIEKLSWIFDGHREHHTNLGRLINEYLEDEKLKQRDETTSIISNSRHSLPEVARAIYEEIMLSQPKRAYIDSEAPTLNRSTSPQIGRSHQKSFQTLSKSEDTGKKIIIPKAPDRANFSRRSLEGRSFRSIVQEMQRDPEAPHSFTEALTKPSQIIKVK